jgi:GT2 family glycosyltransferase
MKAMTGPGESPRELSVILVNYNDRAHLPDCLVSLDKALSGLNAEVILVDNRSADGSASLVRESFSWVRLVENDRNVGYPRANNLGVRLSRGEFVLFLNTDTVVPADAPARLLAEIRSRPEAGAVGPALVREDGSFQVSFGKRVGFFSELRQKLVFNAYYRNALRRSRKPRAVGWLSGACLLVRRSALEAINLFDEGFFLYFEDIDLCRRLAEKGFGLVLCPGIRVYHAGGAATSARPWRSRLEYRRSQLRYYRKHSSRLSLGLLRLYLRLTVFILGLPVGRNGERKLFREGLREVLAGRHAGAEG